MSYWNRLIETYDNAYENAALKDDLPSPIFHTSKLAHINIKISPTGDFVKANLMFDESGKIGKNIIIPVSEKSLTARTNDSTPHPLFDEIKYIAGDYATYDPKRYKSFDSYLKELQNWATSEKFSHPDVKAIYHYVKKGTAIGDMMKSNILSVNNAGNIVPYGNYKFNTEKAVVCWTIAGRIDGNTWENEDIRDCWKRYCDNVHQSKPNSICAITGRNEYISNTHPGYGKFKFISSKDSTGGGNRFTLPGMKIPLSSGGTPMKTTCNTEVGYINSQKVINAWRWLKKRQEIGGSNEQNVIAWCPYYGNRKDIVHPYHNKLDVLDKYLKHLKHRDMGKVYASRLKSLMNGYRDDIGPDKIISIMTTDTASPGRMAVIDYREMVCDDYFHVMNSWYEDFAWPIDVIVKGNGKLKKYKTVRTPFIKDIVKSIGGGDKLKKNVYRDIKNCIIDELDVPQYILEQSLTTVNRAIKKKNESKSERLKRLDKDVHIACCLFRGHYKRQKGEVYPMSLDKENTSRDYLYGRLLAWADNVESFALDKFHKGRTETSASRLRAVFADKPYSTWIDIDTALAVYRKQLLNSEYAGFMIRREKELDEIMDAFDLDDFKNDDCMEGEYLMGYSSQRRYFFEGENI